MEKKIPLAYNSFLESSSQGEDQGLNGIPVRGILIGAVLAFLLNFLLGYFQGKGKLNA